MKIVVGAVDDDTAAAVVDDYTSAAAVDLGLDGIDNRIDDHRLENEMDYRVAVMQDNKDIGFAEMNPWSFRVYLLRL